MANEIRVLTGDNSDRWTLVMHFLVPDVNNVVGVNYRTAIVNSGLGQHEDGRRTVLPSGDGTGGTIDATREALLDSGEMFEYVASYRVESGGTSNAQLQSAIQEFYDSQNAAVQASVGSRLRYFGHTESAG